MTTFTPGHALLVGVGADLPNTVDDAKGIADLLLDPDRCAYPKEQVTLLTAEGASRNPILAALDAFVQRVGPDDTAIVYFSGHGYRVKTAIGAHYYLMPYGYDASNLTETAISGAEFVERLRRLAARKLLLLLDCCHAGGLDDTKVAGVELSKAPMPAEAQSLLAAGQGRIAIASSKAEELSYAGKPYSAFTLALAEALCGVGVAESDGYVRVMDLVLHARQMVPRRTGEKQHPITNEFTNADNFVVAYYAGGETAAKGLPFPVEEIEIEPEPGALNRAVLDQRGQTVHGPQTNITGDVHAPIYSGNIGQIGDRNINLGGGNYYEGDIEVSDGDFVGGNKVDNRGGFYQPGWQVGTVNQISGGTVDLSQRFTTVYTEIERRPADPNVEKEEIVDTVKKIETEAAKGDAANPTKIERWLKFLADAAPDILEVTAQTLVNPVAGVAEGIRKVAARLR
jgi:hypothetical protein